MSKKSNVIKMSTRDKNGKKIKRKPWWVKHNEECDALRASVGARAGEGLKLLERMRRGDETQKALAALYINSYMSANMADALVSLYASNPTLALVMKAKRNPRIVVDNTGNDQCPSSEPTSAANVSIASK